MTREVQQVSTFLSVKYGAVMVRDCISTSGVEIHHWNKQNKTEQKDTKQLHGVTQYTSTQGLTMMTT